MRDSLCLIVTVQKERFIILEERANSELLPPLNILNIGFFFFFCNLSCESTLSIYELFVEMAKVFTKR